LGGSEVTYMPTTPANWPVPLTAVELHGQIVKLEVLTCQHEPELSQICQDEQIWRYLTSYGGNSQAIHRYLKTALDEHQSGSAIPFVIRAISDGSTIGMTRLKNISREHRNAVIGSWLVTAAWGIGANTESKLLLLTHAFEELLCIRVEFHADSRNMRSRAALTKMGAYEEGILRSCHITRDGICRDTVVFSVLDTEWPAVKTKLVARLETQRANRTAAACSGDSCEGDAHA
jgi:N-acetyltransferase